jgi:hypothetical protein
MNNRDEARLYYTPPSDEAFESMRNACMIVWGQYAGNPGGYMEEKVGRIRDIQNVGDNFMYMLAMFDMNNQRSVVSMLSDEAKIALKERMIDGGNDVYHIKTLGL